MVAMATAARRAFHTPFFSRSFTLAAPSLLSFPSLPSSSSSPSPSFASRIRLIHASSPARAQPSGQPIARALASTMVIRMEGSLGDTPGSRISNALEGMHGVSGVKVMFEEEGNVAVECTRTASIYAAGFAADVAATVRKAGFRLRCFTLGFAEDGTLADDGIKGFCIHLGAHGKA